MKPIFFATPATFRSWLERNHRAKTELHVAFDKRSSGKPSITWPESVDEALCFGWIDGRRQSLDDASYVIRFTPRRPRSTWSAINVARVQELGRAGRMHPAGLEAFARRSTDRTGTYSYEQRNDAKLDAASERRFRRNTKAWTYFAAQPPWYRRTSIYWVVSAKKDETREKRLRRLINDSERGRPISQLDRSKKDAGS